MFMNRDKWELGLSRAEIGIFINCIVNALEYYNNESPSEYCDEIDVCEYILSQLRKMLRVGPSKVKQEFTDFICK